MNYTYYEKTKQDNDAVRQAHKLAAQRRLKNVQSKVQSK